MPLAAPAVKVAITIASTVGTLALDYLAWALSPSPPNQTGPRLDDRSVSSSAYGNSIPRCWGTIRTGGNVIWSPGIKETTHVQREGKKKHHYTVTTYTYSVDVAVAFAGGRPAKKFLRVWADSKIIYDITGASGPSRAPAVEYLRFYLGTETQNADPLIQSVKGVADTPAYRGLVGFVMTLQLADYGNRVPQFSAEIAFDDETDSFPYEGPVDGVVANDGHFTDELLIPGQLPFLALHTGKDSINRIYRVNSRTNLLEDHVDLPFTSSGNAVVDPDGFFYIQEDSGPAFNCRMDKIDLLSLQVVGTIGFQGGLGSHTPETDGYYSIQLNHRKCVFDTSDGRKLLALQGTFGQVAIIDRRKITTNDGSWPNGTSDAGGPRVGDEADAIVFGAAADTGFGSSQGGIVGDKNGDVWVTSGDPRTLRHISGDDGSVIADYDVSAFMDAFSSAMAYVAADHTLLIPGTDSKIHKIDCDTGTELATYTLPTQRRVAPGDMWAGQTPDGQDTIIVAGNSQSHAAFSGPWFMRVPALALADAGGYTDYNVQDFFEPEYSGSAGPSGAVYDPYSDSVWMTSRLASLGTNAAGLFRMYLDRATGLGVSLATIVGDLCEQAGLDPSQFDVTDLATTTVLGVILDQQPARDSIRALAQAYLFDASEHDGQIVFVRRLGAPVATIEEDDLGAEDEPGKQSPRVNETIVQETETPAVVEVKFYDKDRDYQQGTQSNKRISLPRSTMDAHGKLAITLPIVMVADDGAKVAQRVLYDMWISRRQFKFAAGVKHSRLDPTDVFQLNYKGKAFEGRMVRTDAGAGGSVAFQAVSHDGEIYTSLIAGGASGGFRGGSLAQYDPTQLILLDIPLLRDVDANSEGSGIYFALGNFGGTWRGAVILRSPDNSTWVSVAGGNTASPWGRTTAALGDFAGVGGWDDTNTLTVRIVGADALVSDSELNVLNGANAAALLKSNGEVELLQWVNATDNGDGTFTLSRLLRGQRGTEWAVPGHAAGELFVVLSQSLGRIKMDLSLRGVQEWYQAVSIGQSSAPSEPLTLQANDLKPYAVAQLGGYLDEASNMIITWARRTRLGGGWQDGTGTVPLNEESELYDVEIYDSTGSTLKRTVSDLTTPTCVYTVAQQTTDFGSPPASVLVKVFQRSAAVGRGFEASATIPTPGGWPVPFPVSYASPTSGQLFYVNGA